MPQTGAAYQALLRAGTVKGIEDVSAKDVE